jgi:hypothetical protein
VWVDGCSRGVGCVGATRLASAAFSDVTTIQEGRKVEGSTRTSWIWVWALDRLP